MEVLKITTLLVLEIFHAFALPPGDLNFTQSACAIPLHFQPQSTYFFCVHVLGALIMNFKVLSFLTLGPPNVATPD